MRDRPLLADDDATPPVRGLTDEALVAALLASAGLPPRRAKTCAMTLLGMYEGLSGLARADPQEIAEVMATTPRAKAERAGRALACAVELGRRGRAAPPPRVVGSAADAGAWGSAQLGALEHEELWLLALDGQNRLRAASCVAKGGLHGVAARAPDVLRAAIRNAASGFVLVHNHPSGDPTPSDDDVVFTRRVADAAAVVGVPLLDHVVVTADAFSSVPLPEAAA